MSIRTLSQQTSVTPFSLLIFNSPEYQLWTITSSAIKQILAITINPKGDS